MTKFALALSLLLLAETGGVAHAQVDNGAAAVAISKFRKANGLGAVTSDAKLIRLAQDQANAMASKDVLDHGVLGAFGPRVAPAGAARVAENIAYGNDDFPRTLDQWIRSSGHRANLLMANGSRIGVARARSGASGRVYWAMLIGGGYEPAHAKPSVSGKGKAASRPRMPCRVNLLGLCL